MSAGVLESPGRHRFARFSAASAFFVLFAGGVLFEHGHRMVAGLTALLVWGLAGWTYWEERRAWVRAMMAAAALGILAQAVLGGATVLWGLPPQVSIAHACLGQALFALVVACAQATSPWFMARRAAPGRPWAPAATAIGVLLLQLLLGATMRHTGKMLAWHLVGAVLAFWALTRAALAGIHSDRRSLGTISTVLMLLALLQVFLGFGALAFRHLRLISAMALLPTAHQAVGAALLGLCVVLALRAGRAEEPA